MIWVLWEQCRNEAGLWVLQSYSPSPDSSFELTSLPLKASLQDIYADVNLPAAPPPPDDSRR